MCVFRPRTPTTQCAHSKAGAGYFGRFGTPWTVYKTKSDHSSDLVVLPSHSGRLRSLRNRWFSACTKAGKLFGDIGGRLPNQHMESKGFWVGTHFAFQCPTFSGWLFFICLPAPFTSNVIFKCSTTLPHITTPDLEYKHSFRQLQPQLWDKPVSQPVERSYQRSTSDLMQQSRHSCKVAAIFPTQCIHANSTNISQPFEMGHWCNLTIWFLPNSSSPGALWLFGNLVVVASNWYKYVVQYLFIPKTIHW